ALERDRLLADLDSVQSAEDAASWAHRSMPAKNTLTMADAQTVEATFREKLATFGDELPGALHEKIEVQAEAPASHPNSEDEQLPVTASKKIAIRHGPVAAKTIRLRNKGHLKFVASQPCLVCSRTPADAHHLRFA